MDQISDGSSDIHEPAIVGTAAASAVAMTPSVTNIMVHADILGRILRCYGASQAIIDELVWMKLVSKQWHVVVSAMFLDDQWLHSFIESGNVFVNSIPALALIIFDWHDLEIDQTALHEYLQQMRMHTRHEAAQFRGIAKIKNILANDPEADITITFGDLQLLYNIINNAMHTHSTVVRVQKIGFLLQYELSRWNQCTSAFPEYSRAVRGLVRAMQIFGDDARQKHLLEVMIKNMMQMIGQGEFMQIEFGQLGAIELVIHFMKANVGDSLFEHKCILILMEFSRDYISLMFSCGVEQVLFERMQRHSDDAGVQLVCMDTLAWFYEHNYPTINLYNDFGAPDIIFNALQNFQHEGGVMQSTLCVFSTLVFIEEYCTICDRFVEEGYVHVFAEHLQVILSSTTSSAIDHRKNELICANIMKTFRAVLDNKHLCSQINFEALKNVIVAGMAKFPTNPEIQYTGCSFFRFVFFPPSDIRRPAPSLEIVQLVLSAMNNNLFGNLLNVECVFTLDTLMHARHVTNYVSRQHGFKLIVHLLYGIIGFESTSPAKISMSTVFSHDCQSKYVHASFSILSKLPPRSYKSEHAITNATVVLASVVTQIMRQHKDETKVQEVALDILNKYIIPHSELHSRFRKDAGLELTQNAMKLPGLSAESHGIAENILRVCVCE
jgi:hypothetical protein